MWKVSTLRRMLKLTLRCILKMLSRHRMMLGMLLHNLTLCVSCRWIRLWISIRFDHFRLYGTFSLIWNSTGCRHETYWVLITLRTFSEQSVRTSLTSKASRLHSRWPTISLTFGISIVTKTLHMTRVTLPDLTSFRHST